MLTRNLMITSTEMIDILSCEPGLSIAEGLRVIVHRND